MKKGGISAILLLAFLVVLAGSSVTQAAWIKDIQIALMPGTAWFNHSASHPSPPSTFQPNFYGNPSAPMLDGIIINTHEATYYQYSVKSATFNLTACNLLNDNSGSGPANGEFAGGSTLTINGELWEKDTGTGVESLVFGSGLLLSATMAASSWDVAEVASFPNNVTGQNNFAPASGELVTGAVAGLKMGDFVAAFFLNACSGLYTGAPVSNFSTQSYKSLSPQVQIVAPIPEPVSMLLLAFGAGMLSRRRK